MRGGNLKPHEVGTSYQEQKSTSVLKPGNCKPSRREASFNQDSHVKGRKRLGKDVQSCKSRGQHLIKNQPSKEIKEKIVTMKSPS